MPGQQFFWWGRRLFVGENQTFEFTLLRAGHFPKLKSISVTTAVVDTQIPDGLQ